MDTKFLGQLSFWEEVAKLAPLGTALIALVTATIAIISIRTQVSIARKRAAIDIFLKTEMDQWMLQSYGTYKEALHSFGAFDSVDEFITKETAKYDAIRNYLNVNELICVGIMKRVFDQRICYGFWGNILKVAAIRGGPIIAHARSEEDSAQTYEEILSVSRRWAGRRWPWQRWRA